MKKLISFMIFLFLSITTTIAQQTYEIKILAKNKNGNIWLRWAPDNPVVWRLGNKFGFHIDRFDLLENGKLVEGVAGRGVRLTENPIKPFTLAQLEELSISDERAGVLIETIYSQDSGDPLAGPADIIQQKNAQENSFGFALFVCDLSTQLAEAAGLFFEDTQIEPGHRYAYRISLAHQPEGIIVEPAVKTIDSKKEEPLTAINDLEAKFADKKVTLAWSEMKYYGVYSAYHIQKSTDGKNFHNISDLPYVHITNGKELNYQYFVDSLNDNNTEFRYRIIGITPFGEKGEPSNVVKGSGIDVLFGAVYIDTVYLQEENNVIQFMVDPYLEDQIGNIYIAKANNADGPFMPIHRKPLKISEKKYVDQQSVYNQYYIVQYQNKENNKQYQSFPYLAQKTDETPPLSPISITGAIDSIGNVHLHWQPNIEEDLLGYRVFAAHRIDDEFIEVTHKILTTPQFNQKINIKNLSRNTYYRIIAVDKRFNTSDYSEIFTLTKPDILPPAAPVFIKEEATEAGILLKWVNSVSNDVVNYKIKRKTTSGIDWQVISEWNAELAKDSIIDNQDIKFGQTYLYQIIAIDSSKNKSVVNSIPVFYAVNNRSGATNLTGQVDKSNKTVILSWESQQPIAGFQVYRASNDGPWQLYHTASSLEKRFIDDNLQISTLYKYKIKLRYQDGFFSGLSKPVEVKY